MKTATKRSKGTQKSTEQLLIEAALSVFAKQSYEGATVKEIADEAGVNVSLISYHYNGKEGLFRACLEHFGRSRLEMAEKILAPPTSLEEFKTRLRLWMEQIIDLHLENPELIVIMNREVLTDFGMIKDIFANTFLKAYRTLLDFLDAAKKKGIIKKNVDSEIFAALVFGTLCHMGRFAHIQSEFFDHSIKESKYRTHLVDHLMNICFQGVKPND